ncbi:hypothetical protein B0H13DRAFT_2265409, partial [Mycena leptocephala]
MPAPADIDASAFIARLSEAVAIPSISESSKEDRIGDGGEWEQGTGWWRGRETGGLRECIALCRATTTGLTPVCPRSLERARVFNNGLRPGRDLHSGVFGHTVHEPMTDLISSMSRLVDSVGNILVPGVDDRVQAAGVEKWEGWGASDCLFVILSGGGRARVRVRVRRDLRKTRGRGERGALSDDKRGARDGDVWGWGCACGFRLSRRGGGRACAVEGEDGGAAAAAGREVARGRPAVDGDEVLLLDDGATAGGGVGAVWVRVCAEGQGGGVSQYGPHPHDTRLHGNADCGWNAPLEAEWSLGEGEGDDAPDVDARGGGKSARRRGGAAESRMREDARGERWQRERDLGNVRTRQSSCAACAFPPSLSLHGIEGPWGEDSHPGEGGGVEGGSLVLGKSRCSTRGSAGSRTGSSGTIRQRSRRRRCVLLLSSLSPSR